MCGMATIYAFLKIIFSGNFLEINSRVNEQTASSGKGKWYKLIAILFAALFSIFWSLGSFFFWFLLGMSLYFGFLALYSSGIEFNLFEGRPREQDRYGSFRNPQGQSQGNPVSATKIVRIVVFSIVGFFFFLVLVGLFVGEDAPDSTDTTSSENASMPDEANGTIDYTTKGNDFFSAANYDSAIWCYDQVLAGNPTDQYGLYNKSLSFFMKKEFTTSIDIVKKCLAEHPDYNEAWWLLGDDYYSINNLDSATYCLERAYNNNFREANFLQLMAENYVKLGEQQKAKEFYLQVVDKDPSNVDSYKELIKLDPENSDQYQRKISELEAEK
jgi:tetratricopeptide (TPR) repeat protein